MRVGEASLLHWKFSSLSRLLYRDTLKQKHSDQPEILKQIKNSANTAADSRPSHAKAKMIREGAETLPLAEVLLKHLLRAAEL